MVGRWERPAVGLDEAWSSGVGGAATAVLPLPRARATISTAASAQPACAAVHPAGSLPPPRCNGAPGEGLGVAGLVVVARARAAEGWEAAARAAEGWEVAARAEAGLGAAARAAGLGAAGDWAAARRPLGARSRPAPAGQRPPGRRSSGGRWPAQAPPQLSRQRWMACRWCHQWCQAPQCRPPRQPQGRKSHPGRCSRPPGTAQARGGARGDVGRARRVVVRSPLPPHAAALSAAQLVTAC